MALSNYLRNKLLDHSLATAAFTVPAGVFVKMHTGDPGVNCTANPAGATTRHAATFAAAAAGSAAISGIVAWTAGETTAAETWSWFSTWDAAAAGNPLHYGQITTPRTVAIGDTPSFAAGQLVVTAT